MSWFGKMFKKNKKFINTDIVSTDLKTIESDSAIENYGDILEYICEDKDRSILLTTYLKKELTELFGKYNTRYKGEFNYFVWIVNFNNVTFNIYTANGKGTQFTIVNNHEIDTEFYCESFIRKIEEKLKKIKL